MLISVISNVDKLKFQNFEDFFKIGIKNPKKCRVGNL